ncbi:DUF222 domain-containing protein [Micrococcaceae bacterium Sec7.4]
MDSTDCIADGREALAAVGVLTAALDSVVGTGAGADGAGPSGAIVRRDAGPLRDDPLRELADDCLDGLAEVARWEARAAALKVRLGAAYLRATDAMAAPAAAPHDAKCQEMAVVAEVACVLTVSERTAGAFLSECVALTRGLPLTLAALQDGTISWQHARIIVDETAGLDPAGAAGLEAHFLDPDPARGCPAGELVPARFRAKARTWRERHHRESIESRHTKSAADRRVEYRPDSDGMAWFSAYLPADTAAGIWARTTAAARVLQGPAEARTLTQLRADVAATWLLTTGTEGEGAGGGVPSPRAQVLVTVPVFSLLGAGEEPAVLDGYGPIPPSMARRLVAEGADSFYRVLVDPRDGAPLEIGRSSYRVPKAVRQWLRLRDGKCPFPGCNNQSLDNDADHLLAWADGGTTGISNLGQPCRKHHGLKHNSAWTPAGASKDAPPGWTSPSGRHYPSEQQDWEPPHWPDRLQAMVTLLAEGVPEDPGPDPNQELPPDPFPDWHLFTAGHPFPAADNRASDWLQPFDESILEYFLVEAL